MKPYKACLPTATINKIRKNLDEVGIFLQESSYKSNDSLFAARLTMSGKFSNLDIGTNGKGTTYEYALASGYAEFMERLQNNILFRGYKNAEKHNIAEMNDCYYKNTLIKENLVLDFLFDPKEITVPVEIEIENHFDFLQSLFPFISTKAEAIHFFKDYLQFKDFICVPFYSAEEKDEILLPIELIRIACGSNGMASGNTQDEALIQGFCEIFERYAGMQIYNNNLTPPTIPISEFIDYPVYNIVQKLLDENEYTLIVKDCSLGIGLPVIGVLIVDEKNGKYNFNMGSALNPGVALERCLTELHQSATGLSWYDMKFEQYANSPRYDENYVFANENKLFLDGSGDWTLSLFKDVPSYEYNGLNRSLDMTDCEDIDFIKKMVYSLGYNIYIRDVSFMGLNSYYIVIPGMSQFPQKKRHYDLLNDSIYNLNSIRDIENVSKEKLLDICKSINADYNYLKMFNYNINELLVFHLNKDLLEMKLEVLFFMLNYKAGLTKEAYYYLSEFLKDKDFANYKYYYGIKDYIKLKLENYNDSEIENILRILYKDETSEIINDVKDPERIMQYYQWPQNFRCEKCGLFNDCLQIDLLRIIKKIQKKYQDANIDHHSFNF